MKGKGLIFRTLRPQIPDSGKGVTKAKENHLFPCLLFKNNIIYIDCGFIKNKAEFPALV